MTEPKRMGRPPLPADQKHAARFELRLTEAQRVKLLALGGADWLRAKIDNAKKPEQT